MKQIDLERSSRRLAFVLRHSHNVRHQVGGWVSIHEALEQAGITRELLCEIVSTDRKTRFEINESADAVRALYGHSVTVDMGYGEVEPPPTLLHGTTKNLVNRILHEGIQSRARQYVHLTDDLAMALATGSRHGDAAVVSVDVARMVEGGFKFYSPAPNLWLVNSVPSQYVEHDK